MHEGSYYPDEYCCRKKVFHNCAIPIADRILIGTQHVEKTRVNHCELSHLKQCQVRLPFFASSPRHGRKEM